MPKTKNTKKQAHKPVLEGKARSMQARLWEATRFSKSSPHSHHIMEEIILCWPQIINREQHGFFGVFGLMPLESILLHVLIMVQWGCMINQWERERAVTYWNINQHSACWDSSYWVFPISISLYPKQPRSIWYPKSPLDSKQYPGVPLENILVRNNMPCPFITCETCVWTAKCLNCSTVKNNGCTVSSSNLVENTSSGVLAVMFMAICKNCHAMFIWSFFTLGSLAVSSVVHTVLLSKLYLWNNKIKVNIRWTVLSIFKMTALLKSPKHFFLTLSRSLRNLFSRNIHYVSKMILWDISRYFGKLWLK